MSEPTPPPPGTPPAPAAAPIATPIATPDTIAAPATIATPAAVAAPPPAASAAPRQSFLDQASIRPTVIIAVIIAALFYGTQILNEALPAVASEVAVSAGGAVDIGQGLTITPRPGWAASAHDSGNGVRLEKGIVVLDLFTQTGGTSAKELAEAYRDEVLAADTTQFTATTIETFGSNSGTSGARLRYQGVFTGVDVAIEGEVTVLFEGGLGVIADAWTRQGDLDDALTDIHGMVETIGAAQ